MLLRSNELLTLTDNNVLATHRGPTSYIIALCTRCNAVETDRRATVHKDRFSVRDLCIYTYIYVIRTSDALCEQWLACCASRECAVLQWCGGRSAVARSVSFCRTFFWRTSGPKLLLYRRS